MGEAGVYCTKRSLAGHTLRRVFIFIERFEKALNRVMLCTYREQEVYRTIDYTRTYRPDPDPDPDVPARYYDVTLSAARARTGCAHLRTYTLAHDRRVTPHFIRRQAQLMVLQY